MARKNRLTNKILLGDFAPKFAELNDDVLLDKSGHGNWQNYQRINGFNYN